MSSTIISNNVDMLLEAAEKIRENEDAIETKLDIMSMPVYIENERMNIDEVIEAQSSIVPKIDQVMDQNDARFLVVPKEKRTKCVHKNCKNIKHQ